MAWHAAQTGNAELLTTLIFNGVDINKKGGSPVLSTPLQIAAQHQNTSVLEVLLKYRAHTEVVDQLGKTVLHVAVFEGRFNVVKLLLEYGANVSAKAMDGKTALHFAVQLGRIDVIKLLIFYGANVSDVDNSGYSPLHYATQHNQRDIVYLLLQHNVSVNELESSPVVGDAVSRPYCTQRPACGPYHREIMASPRLDMEYSDDCI
jgi:ankyrin repeat protein